MVEKDPQITVNEQDFKNAHPADKYDEEDDEVYDDGRLSEAVVVLNWDTDALSQKKKSKDNIVEYIETHGGVSVKQSDNVFVFGSEEDIFDCFRDMKQKYPWISDSKSKIMDPLIVSAPKAGHFEYADQLL